MNKIVTYLFLLLFLDLIVACREKTTLSPSETPVSKTVSPTPGPTSTPILVTVTPSPLPTKPTIPVIAPNANQIEHWMAYEDALAKAFFKSSLQPKEVVCEWEILGQTEQEVYVDAHCAGIYSANPYRATIPAVIYLGMDGEVINAEIPGSRSSYNADIRAMFPSNVQEKIFIQPVDYYGSDAYWRAIERADRLRWRRGHPDEPPWIVISTLHTQPTPAIIPWLKPEPIQIEKWKDYQTALADEFNYRPPEEVICEWEFLGQSGNEVYVWAICGAIYDYIIGSEGLAIVHLSDDGSVISANGDLISFPSEIQDAFPLVVQERYFSGQIHFQELVDRLRWRQRNPDELPLIVLHATSTP